MSYFQPRVVAAFVLLLAAISACSKSPGEEKPNTSTQPAIDPNGSKSVPPPQNAGNSPKNDDSSTQMLKNLDGKGTRDIPIKASDLSCNYLQGYVKNSIPHVEVDLEKLNITFLGADKTSQIIGGGVGDDTDICKKLESMRSNVFHAKLSWDVGPSQNIPNYGCRRYFVVSIVFSDFLGSSGDPVKLFLETIPASCS